MLDCLSVHLLWLGTYALSYNIAGTGYTPIEGNVTTKNGKYSFGP